MTTPINRQVILIANRLDISIIQALKILDIKAKYEEEHKEER